MFKKTIALASIAQRQTFCRKSFILKKPSHWQALRDFPHRRDESFVALEHIAQLPGARSARRHTYSIGEIPRVNCPMANLF